MIEMADGEQLHSIKDVKALWGENAASQGVKTRRHGNRFLKSPDADPWCCREPWWQKRPTI